jgi:NAD(P)-dependent dehydrogenase (short-subunit alcohol dehydrogenase family)
MGVPEQILKLSGDKLEKTNFYGYPQDIANVIAFLASNEASFVNGSNVVVDGGVLWSNFVFDL